MNDILPAQSAAFEALELAVRAWAKRYGYGEIRLPILEKTELFVRSIGEVTDIVEKEMYTFTDQLNGERLTLRPEATASCVRAVLQHNLLYEAPQRLFYIGPMFRHERPQKGRYRQFHQVGVEAMGFAGPEIEAEHLIMTSRLWKTLGIQDVTLEINTLGKPDERAAYRARLIEYLERHRDALDEDAQRRLHANPLRILDSKRPATQTIVAGAPRLFDDLGETSRAHFEMLQALLRDAGVAYTINPKLVRGLDYYNDTVYEWVTDRLGAQGTVCAGGRYDGLLEQIGGKPAPACGFALGIERVLELVEAPQERASVDVFVAHMGSAVASYAMRIAEQLRDQGLNVIFHCGGGQLKNQMKRADASGAAYAVIIGDDERDKGEITLKPLRGQGEQRRMAPTELRKSLRTAESPSEVV